MPIAPQAFILGSWDPSTRASAFDLVDLCEALSRIGQRELLDRRLRIPPLYASGVLYREDPPNQQRWLTPAAAISAGYTDCKSLTAWRLAELRNAGVKCRAAYRQIRRKNGTYLIHLLIEKLQGGAIVEEDPSEVVAQLERTR